MSDYTSQFSALSPSYVLHDRYHIQSLLDEGIGGFSLVYFAWDNKLEKRVIVKECAPAGIVMRDIGNQVFCEPGSQEKIFSRALDNSAFEAQVLRDLTEKMTVGISDYIDDFHANGTHYTVMEYVEGRSFHYWQHYYSRKNKLFPTKALVHILSQILSILHSIHEQGYYHCDIKPANIIVTDSGDVYLIDFGACRTQERQHTKNVAISPGYSPPEFYPGHRLSIGSWTDIYMLGAVMYHAISGIVPEPADQRAVRDRNPRISSQPHIAKSYPYTLLVSVEKALNIDARDRFADAGLWKDYYTAAQSGPQLKRATNAPLRRVTPGVFAKVTPGMDTAVPLPSKAKAEANKSGGEGKLMIVVIASLMAALAVVFFLMKK